jgi:hypothetical protein
MRMTDKFFTRQHLEFSIENKLSDEPDAPNLKTDMNFKRHR